MAKLFATLETSRGKTVSVSDNEEIVATLYDGNMKAYSVHIEWCVIGDPEHYSVNVELFGDIDEAEEYAQKHGGTVETIPAVMGASITLREWRNEPDEKRKEK